MKMHRVVAVATILTAGAGLLWLASASLAREPMHASVQAATGNGSTSTTSPAPSTTPPAPAGDPSASITAPVNGSTVAAGSAVTLTARGSGDLVNALASTPRSCWFTVGDNANSTVTGTLDAATATCSAAWTFTYQAAFAITGWFATSSTIAYATPASTLNVTGAASPRCVGAASAGCAYKWVEVYYTTNTAYSGRVCGIDQCQWVSTHTSWTQVPGMDYWLNRTGTLASGDVAEADVCIGTSNADWSAYSSGNVAALLAKPETSANPLPAGTC